MLGIPSALGILAELVLQKSLSAWVSEILLAIVQGRGDLQTAPGNISFTAWWLLKRGRRIYICGYVQGPTAPCPYAMLKVPPLPRSPSLWGRDGYGDFLPFPPVGVGVVPPYLHTCVHTCMHAMHACPNVYMHACVACMHVLPSAHV